MSDNEPVAELIAMLDAAVPTDQGAIFDHTPEEIGLHVMENVWAILAALRRPAREEVSGEEVERVVLPNGDPVAPDWAIQKVLEICAPTYWSLENVKAFHVTEKWSRNILAIASYIAAMNPKPAEAASGAGEPVPGIGVRALNLARCLAKAEFRSEVDRCIDEAKAIMNGGAVQIPPAADVAAMRKALEKIVKAGTFQPHSDDPPSYDSYADIARQALAALPDGGAKKVRIVFHPDTQAKWDAREKAARLAKALGEIRHSITQARIPGNDWRRELVLIENIVQAALPEEPSA
ncbi:hypothetical protein [Novosphingobium sp. ZW T3_23]|uniref:hypothetical protein n=1 Tax=Novosphingobium sp. ZW T3_23 TaxID=3378084 RepID=UPI003853862F